MALSKPGKSSSLSLFRNILVVLRIGILLGGAVLILIFLGSFLLDILFVPSSAVVRSGLAKFVHSVADPVVAALVSGVRINTRVRGTETMPLIITAVLFAVTAFLNGQAQRLLEWIEEQQQARELEARRVQRKAAREAQATAEPQKKGIFSTLLRGKRKEEELLRARQELEKFRKKLAFLSIEMVDAARLKEGRDPLLTERLFREYRLLLETVLKQHRHRAASWSPDGVMACFLQAEVGGQAAKSLLRALPDFNRKKNPVDVPIQVRCGVHVGDVLFDERTPLEQLSDRVLDVTGQLQRSARPNSLLISQTVYEQVRDKAGFAAVAEVDGYPAFEWSAEPRAALTASKVVPVVGAMDVTVGPNNPTLAFGKQTAGAGAPAGPNDPTVVFGMSSPGAATLSGPTPQRIGRYEVLSELGRGAMGVVYKARDPQIGRTVAIKMILTGSVPPQYVAEYKKRFFREAQTAGLMSHPNIVTIYDIAEHESGQPYLVMEFVEGATIEKLLSPKFEGDTAERFPLERALDIIIQTCEALDCAHTRGVIHRDIKPANVLYTVDGKAKLADFGIAKLEGSQLTQTGTFMGTPAFMSPEQFTGAALDQRSDLFSLGAVLYWMLTGETPFPGKTVTAIMFKILHSDPVPLQELDSALPKDLDLVLGRCLAKRPEERYTTAREFGDDLRAILAGREPSVGASRRASAPLSNAIGDSA